MRSTSVRVNVDSYYFVRDAPSALTSDGLMYAGGHVYVHW